MEMTRSEESIQARAKADGLEVSKLPVEWQADRHETGERPVSVPRRSVWAESGMSGSRAAGFVRNIMCLKELYNCYQSKSTVLGAKPHLPPIFDVS